MRPKRRVRGRQRASRAMALLLGLSLLASLLVAGPAAVAAPNEAIVNSTGDLPDLVPGDDLCDTGGLVGLDAECTLRAAVEEANTSALVDTILFAIPTTDSGYTAIPLSYTIAPGTLLPAVTAPVTIDGRSQPGYAGLPVVVLDGSTVVPGADDDGLDITSGSSVVQGLAIVRFAGDGIELSGGGGNTVIGNHIGVDVTGTQSGFGNGVDAIHIVSNGNVIGGPGGASDRNLLSGNGDEGVDVDPGYSGNTIVGNYVGTDVTGTAAIGNGGPVWSGGMLIDGSANTVGGTTAAERNLVSGNVGYGVIQNGSGNVVTGNWIGVAADGVTPLGNGRAGVILGGVTSSQKVGGSALGSGNLIAHNAGAGILVQSGVGSDNSFLGNSIHNNAGLGIDLNDDGVTPNDVNDADTGPNGLLNFPIITFAAERSGTVDLRFEVDVDPGDYRVEIFSSAVVDSSGHGEGQTFVRSIDVIGHLGGTATYSTSFPGAVGDFITATTTQQVSPPFGSTSEFGPAVAVVAGTLVVNSTGDASDALVGDGICSTGLLNTAFDPECTLRAALEEANADTVSDTIHFAIPTSEPGYSASPLAYTMTPGAPYPYIDSPVILDATTQPGYLGDPIVELDGNAAAGATAGLVLRTDDSLIRGFAVHSFSDEGLEIDGTTGYGDRNTLADNWVGIDPGQGLRFNADNGILVTTGSDSNIIARNVVGGSADAGIEIRRAGNDDNVVVGNFIGVAPDGVTPIPNDSHGIELWDLTTGNRIGGTDPSDANVIAYNDGAGVAVFSDAGLVNTVLGNRIFENAGLGIDLGVDGVTPNDFNDADGGVNELLNHPVIESAVAAAGTVYLAYTLEVPVGNFRVEFFSNPAADPSGYGEGASVLSAVDVVGHPGGAETYLTTVSGSPGDIVTATVTRGLAAPFGGTSEFSAAVTAVAAQFEVNSTGDGTDDLVGDGICSTGAFNTATNVECTVRAAIQETNAVAGPDTVTFDIPTSESGYSAAPLSYTVSVGAGLPPVAGATTLDASTQPGFAGSPIVVLDGTFAGVSDGLVLAGDGGEVRGFVVQNFGDDGIQIDGNGNTVAGNFVGVDVSGSSAGNDDGILVFGSGNFVGGPALVDRNVAAGNADDGISIDGGTSNVVQGNLVGLNPSGTGAVPNGGDGIAVQFGAISTTVDQNISSGNAGAGIKVASAGTTGTQLTGNAVGMNGAGTGPVPNQSHGIHITDTAPGAVVGGDGPSDPNVVAHNVSGGVVVDGDATSVAIVANSIHSNGALGIDLGGDGVTLNDGGDADVGTNGLLNFPDFNWVSELAGTVTANFDLDVPGGTYRIDFFINPSGTDVSGYGEGETAIDSTVVTQGGAGAETFTETFPGSAGDVVTATATQCVDLACGSFSATSEFSEAYTVVPGNNAPVLGAIGPQTGNELVPLTFTATASDVDLDGLSFSLVGAPVGASIDASSGDFTWTPSEDQDGLWFFDVVVTDDGLPSESDQETVAVTVAEVNAAPVLAPIAPLSGAELTAITFTAVAADSDVPANSLAYTLAGAPAGASIDPSSGTFVWTPTEAQDGVYSFDIVVTDDGSPALSDAETVVITVTETNTAPVVVDPGDRVNGEGDAVSLLIVATDADLPSDPLTFSAGGLPNGLSIDPSTGLVSGTIDPTAATGSPYPVTVTVTDDAGASDGVAFTWTVVDTNRSPILVPVADVTVAEQTALLVDVDAFDPDGDGYSFALVGQPAGAGIDPFTGLLTWTPSEGQDGTWVFNVVVTDDGSPQLSASQAVTVTVAEVNTAPVVAAPADPENMVGDFVSMPVVATDTDLPANTLTWTATGLPAGLSIDAGTGVISGSIAQAAAEAETWPVTVTATDDGTPALSDTASFVWVINRAPTARPDTYTVAPGGQLVIAPPGLRANDSDADGDVLVVSLVSGPSRGSLTLDAGGGFTYRNLDGGEVDDFFVYRIEDGRGGSSVASVFINVERPNAAPTAIADFVTGDEDTPIQVEPLINDLDSDGDPLQLVGVEQPEVGVVTVIGDVVVYLPPADFDGVVRFSYQVGDDRDGVATGVVTLGINAVNDQPVAGDDRVDLAHYRPQPVAVLANDRDVDGDPLVVTIVSEPSHARATALPDGRIEVQADIGWVGSDSFTYSITDPSGATSQATVEIRVSRQASQVAVQLADAVGTSNLALDAAPDAVVGSFRGLTLDRVELMTAAFFQTAGALQLPLVFLVMTFGVLLALGFSPTGGSVFAGTRRRYWSAVLLHRESSLGVYEEPGDTRTIYTFEPTVRGILSLVPPRTMGGNKWIQIDTPAGEGWIRRDQVVQQIDLASFMDDGRPVAMVAKLAERLAEGRSIRSLVSKRGLIVSQGGATQLITADRLDELVRPSAMTTSILWRSMDLEANFRTVVIDPFLTTYASTSQIDPKTPHSRRALIPTECWNFAYLALSGDGQEPPWLVYFEYVNGRPRIAGLGVDV